eukprot:365257-Chlamydomonas_euryale.AAC.14
MGLVEFRRYLFNSAVQRAAYTFPAIERRLIPWQYGQKHTMAPGSMDRNILNPKHICKPRLRVWGAAGLTRAQRVANGLAPSQPQRRQPRRAACEALRRRTGGPRQLHTRQAREAGQRRPVAHAPAAVERDARKRGHACTACERLRMGGGWGGRQRRGVLGMCV